ncbi:MAG TPA: NAD(P)-binding protein [Cellvibrio sp.]|nr:NAD(P)-binding protein [Cellvibrio sp.]
MSGITRRDFLLGGSGLLLLGCSETGSALPKGQLLGPDSSIGHRLRDGQFPPPSRELHKPVLIVGAGIAGLSCGWWLQRKGIADFSIVELEGAPGGNSRSGHNAVSAFPWGAHYLPLPGVDATYVRLLLAELGVLKGDITATAPAYDEQMLVQAPDERLFIHGGWQEGLLPRVGIGANAQAEIQRFEALMTQWSSRKGGDGRFVFTIPSALGSADPEFLALDKITFNTWLLQHNLVTPPLHWYVSYSLRDDFGVDQHQVSAWAGLHYFCCRRGLAANAEPQTVLTSPQGNGWIVERLAQKLAPQLASGQAVVRIEAGDKGVSADIFDAAAQEVVRIHCQQLVWAAPLFVLPRVWGAMPRIALPDYAPWLVANLTLDAVDESEFTTWDNVIYQGQGLGYVDATHQQMSYRRPQRVLTYYHALNNPDLRAARRQLLEASHESWSRLVFKDLQKAHPRLESQVRAIDLWRWPHAMAIPAPGFLTALPQRQQSPHTRIHLAHSDLSGFSLFEEAQYWGIEAAERVISS